VSKRAININACQIISVVFIRRRGRRKLGRKWRWSGQIKVRRKKKYKTKRCVRRCRSKKG